MRLVFHTALVLLMLQSKAWALSCVAPEPIKNNTIFFEGTVLSKKLLSGSEEKPEFDNEYEYKIRVDKAWHGAEEGEEFTLRQHFWYSTGHEVGKTGALALPSRNNENSYEFGVCSFPFFYPYDEAGALKPEFTERLNQLKAKSDE